MLKKRKTKHLKAEDRFKTIIKYEDSEKQLNITTVNPKVSKNIVKPKTNVYNNLKIEVSIPGIRKIMNITEHVSKAVNTDKKNIRDNDEDANKNSKIMEKHEENNSTLYNASSSAFIETLCSDQNIPKKG